ncbi:hypothetical protein NDU88_004563 [Pleurodeles waltl]|uniref:Uncharacterized protein n=1 Tax=Pleurodeles waltl TaxID=8319 RepID=A0AAV7L1T3_PLEWA|nr:hypothetical protein NDU88_004563 [Pleurodeles waltl]
MFLLNGNVDGGISESVWMKEMQKDEVLLKVKEFILKGWPSQRNLRGKRCVVHGSNVECISTFDLHHKMEKVEFVGRRLIQEVGSDIAPVMDHITS